MEKRLGKIEAVSVGHGGYQDACLGINFTLSGNGGWGVCDSKTSWDANMIKHDEHCKWTEKDRSRQYDEIMRYISDLLKDAKVHDVNDLVGIPVECNFDGNTLRNWRILKEVL